VVGLPVLLSWPEIITQNYLYKSGYEVEEEEKVGRLNLKFSQFSFFPPITGAEALYVSNATDRYYVKNPNLDLYFSKRTPWILALFLYRYDQATKSQLKYPTKLQR
jgi:hypothetical protein